MWLEEDSAGEQLVEHGDGLHGADLIDTDLRGADLRGADLQFTDLRDADLTGADLRGADLRGADLRDADLQFADLRGADLRGANFSGSTGITYAACTWSGHGELLGMIVDGAPVYLCGWFAGSEEDLRALIESEPLHRAARMLALEFVRARLEEELTK
jgi:hypothetical protein